MDKLTIRELFFYGKMTLSSAGVENSEFESKQLLSHVCGLPPAAIPHENTGAAPHVILEFNEFLIRRKSREPLQYILGEWEFYSLPLKVHEGVLIPRPETELLVDLALESLRNTRSPRILDLCTGSGCIAAALAKNRPDAHVTASDYYEIPLKIAAENLRDYDNAEIARINVLNPPEPGLISRFNLITANPPYISGTELNSLSPEVKKEPREALWGGDDGLKFYNSLAEYWVDALVPGGLMIVEIGYNQGESVSKILQNSLDSIKIHKDYSGIDRIISGIKGRI